MEQLEARPPEERNYKSDLERTMAFATKMVGKWDAGREKHGTAVPMSDPLKEAESECLDLANYSMDIYYRIQRLKDRLQTDLSKLLTEAGQGITLPDVAEFVSEMERKVIKAIPKYGDFEDWEVWNYIEHFKDEVKELLEGLERARNYPNNPQWWDVKREAVDVANIAYMIWFKAKEMENAD